ncbi:MAG: sigma-70 family RNA polymerase sigma factor [Bacteroidales bacterium]|nr:sigma-70 family RNA polymerase sigma factor [Bacteroidales bacterium]
MKPIDEHIYIKRTLEGDVHSFGEVVKNYHLMVYTMAYRVLKNREEAEELAQDVFLKVYQSLAGSNMKSKLSTWIYRITYNSSINRLKSQKRKIETTELDYSVEFDNLSLPDANYNINQKEKRKIIIDA